MRLRLGCPIVICALAGLFLAPDLDPQIVVQKPLRLSHVYGYVLSESGKPLAAVQVTLASGRQPSQAVTTDAKGFFDFPDAKGEYLFHVRIPGSASANRQVVVGAKEGSSGPLYIMIKPVVCEDCVSPIFTNKKQFDEAMREINGNHN